VSFPNRVKPVLPTTKPSFIDVAKARANKQFIPSKTRLNNKPGYVFTTGKYGLGMYKNTQAVQGPQLPSAYVPPTQNINTAMTKAQAQEEIRALGIKKESVFLANLNVKNAKYANIVTRARVQKGNEDELVKFINGTNLPNAKKAELKNKIATNSINAVRRATEEARNTPKTNNGPNVPKNNVPKTNNGPERSREQRPQEQRSEEQRSKRPQEQRSQEQRPQEQRSQEQRSQEQRSQEPTTVRTFPRTTFQTFPRTTTVRM
jgi:hypothetical protein